MTVLEEIKLKLSPFWGDFEKLMSSALVSKSSMLNTINDYLLEASGKQLRPMLAIAVANAGNGLCNDKVVACAAASELIHTATLLHDDVVDDSDNRRGRLTVKKAFSPGASLLLGDYWLTKAINVLISRGCPSEVLSLFAGTLEALAEGELIQMELADSLKTGYGDYEEIISRKTASLFVASVKSSAIVSGMSPDEIEAVSRYAYNLGLSFQMRDDILDYYPTSVSGKDSNCDIEERKVTLPLLCAFSNNPAMESEIREKMRAIDPMSLDKEKNAAIVTEVRNFVMKNGGLQSAAEFLGNKLKEAVDALSVLGDSYFKEALVSLALSLQRI